MTCSATDLESECLCKEVAISYFTTYHLKKTYLSRLIEKNGRLLRHRYFNFRLEFPLSTYDV